MQRPRLTHTDANTEYDALQEELGRLRTAADNGYADARASINLSVDEKLHAAVKQAAKQYENADALVVIGIGGSNLGTQAVHQALHGNHHNQLRTPAVYFADTVDAQDLADLQATLKKHYDRGERVVLCAISKSGSTTETIANLELLLETHKRRAENWAQDTIIITGENSKLDGYAQQHEIQTLHIPANVGGRYSVLSPVGLLPLSITGADTDQLLAGARQARKDTLIDAEDNPAAKRAATRHEQLQQGKNVHELFVFAKNLEGIGRWARQLYAESLGKDGRGFTPTVAVGSTDLHSVAQLRLDGDDHAHTTFVGVQHAPTLTLGEDQEFEALVKDLQGKPLATIMSAIQQATQHAYQQAGRSYDTITLAQLDEHSIGYFLQLLMSETMLLAAMLEINAFDQPAVETYKKRTRELLRNE